MARDPEAIATELQRLLDPQVRNRLRALGLARSMVWRSGTVPEGGPPFREDLSEDLLDFGYSVLALALELRDANRTLADQQPYATDRAFTLAAECVESAVRRGDPGDGTRGRHLVVAAAAFHLGGYAARSFSLLPSSVLAANLASSERALALLLRRDLDDLRLQVREWLDAGENSDETVARRLADEQDDFGIDEAIIIALNAAYFRALGYLDTALMLGDENAHTLAITALETVVGHASEAGNLTMWWVSALTRHIARDLWEHSLHVCLPRGPLPESWDEWRRSFISVLSARQRPQVDLWPSQREAARRAIDPNDDLIVALPTSSGKTRIAELCILRTLADDRRVMYVTPLRALSAQVEQILARTFVPLGASVTSLYGAAGATSLDLTTLATASIVVSTPEKLDFALRQDPGVLDDVGLIVFDEGHMIGVGSREIRYEVLIQRLLRRSDSSSRRIVCLSAMFNPQDEFFQDFGAWLRSDSPGELINVDWRPTRQLLATLDWRDGRAAWLQFSDAEKPYVPRFFEEQPPLGRRRKPFPQDDKEFCVAATLAFARDGHDVLVYSPQRRQIEPLVESFCTAGQQGYMKDTRRPAPDDIAYALAIGREWLGENHAAVRALPFGIGTHHGWLPRPFLSAIEDLLNARRLPVVVASPTLAQGIDLACSVLVFRSVTRFDPSRGELVPIPASEFSNVLGRAGRAYVDLDGIAVFPTFKSGRARNRELRDFQELVKESRGQRLTSGIYVLVMNIVGELCRRLGADPARFVEYVVNHQDIWSNSRLEAADGLLDDADAATQTLDEMLSDLDIALLSLVEDADAPIDALATLLDTALTGSLWKRTLERMPDAAKAEQLEREVLYSRVRWLWRNTTPELRQACFSAGLGRRAGVHLYNHLDTLVADLVELHSGVTTGDRGRTRGAAISFAKCVFGERFFRPHAMPDDWSDVLGAWVEGRAFADILANSSDKAAGFVYDGIVFKLVWAAEAVRVQATTTNHPGAVDLGDGPALAFTHGLPSASAALLCQFGYPSRTGALWLVEQLGADFTDYKEMRIWEATHSSVFDDPHFWRSTDHRLLWEMSRLSSGNSSVKKWLRTEHSASPVWRSAVPSRGTQLRLVKMSGSQMALCDSMLTTLGEVTLPFDASNCALSAFVARNGRLVISRFGPA